MNSQATAALSLASCGMTGSAALVDTEEEMLKKWIAKKKAQWVFKWAEEFGLHVVQIKVSSGTEYIVDKNGAWRKLARAK